MQWSALKQASHHTRLLTATGGLQCPRPRCSGQFASLASVLPSDSKHSARLSGRTADDTLLTCTALSTRHAYTKRSEGSVEAPAAVSSAYIHLPFCKRRCYYCDFPVAVLGSRAGTGPSQAVQEYTDALLREIKATPRHSAARLDTVYFGGGTPSLIPPQLLKVILQVLDDKFGISKTAEISMEADPGTFDQQRLQEYMQLGVNRFSVGIQSFQEDVLKACGRSHSLADVVDAVEAIQQARVPCWSLDLMSGLPHLTAATWADALQKAIALSPDHISVYDLQVEDKTPFSRWYTPGAAPLPTDEAAADMFRTASCKLSSAGYEHYEISSFARPGKRCQHNMAYWLSRPFYGFGLGATSNVDNVRFARPRTMAAYYKWVETFDGGSSIHSTVPDDDAEQLLDAVMLRLRMSDGLDMDWLAQQFGQLCAEQVAASLQPHIANGLAEFKPGKSGTNGHHTGHVRLADPEGFLMSNDIISDIFVALDSS